ncbi:hypothetical protein SESBI_22024 [Sesbania bispinosa]|nr:hypothetical protein SESBI_22024 [Sesbania bispinosa]
MSRDYVFGLDELSDSEILVVKALQAFKEKHGFWGDMAGNNIAGSGGRKRPSVRPLRRQAADAEAAVATGAGSSALPSSQPAVANVTQERPRKKVRTEALKGSLDSRKDPKEDAAMKLLGQQGQRNFSIALLTRWPPFPKLKKDFEAVSKKLKDDEVVMQDALKKVKGLSDENLKLTDKNKELEEEIKKLKSDLETKRSEAIQAAIQKQKMAEDPRGCQRGMEAQVVPGGTGKFFVAEDPSDVEITPPPMQPITLEADVVTEDMKGPSEYEMVDAQILGLEDSQPTSAAQG